MDSSFIRSVTKLQIQTVIQKWEMQLTNFINLLYVFHFSRSDIVRHLDSFTSTAGTALLDDGLISDGEFFSVLRNG